MTPMDQALGEMRFLNEDTDTRYRERDLRKYAKEKDLVLVIPNDDQLLIDIDTFEDRRIFDAYFDIFLEKFPTASFVMNLSRNKVDGRHVTVTVPGKKFTALERIAYQAALGSDRKRELLSLFDLAKGLELPSVFFEKK